MSARKIPELTAVILAGGRGSRLGARDKGLVEIGGQPLAGILLARLRPQVGRVMISANRNLEHYRIFDCPVIADTIGGYPGPLGGMLAALENCPTDFLLTLPCDAPFVNHDYAQRMWQRMHATQKTAAVAHDGERLQPVYALLPKSAAAELAAFLDSGRDRTRDWISSLSPAGVDFSDAPLQFTGANTETELAALEALLETSK